MSFILVSIGGYILVLALYALLSLLIGLPWMLLWNASLPQLFNAPTLSYGQSFAIVYLLVLVGNFFSNSIKTKE